MGEDLSDKYNTKLSDEEESQFQAFAKEKKRDKDVADYDLRGWWKKNAGKDADGHLTDEFKKPNHPTFSKESVYSGKDGNEGGEWKGDDKSGYTFKASKTNKKNMTRKEMDDYFARVEPGNKLEYDDDKAPKNKSPLYDNPRSP